MTLGSSGPASSSFVDPEGLPEGSVERMLAWRDRGYQILQDRRDRTQLRSWLPVDLAPFVAGLAAPLKPTQFARSDGVALLYPGRLHDFHGEPETLKSLAAQLAVAQVLLDGGTAFYVDHEAEARDVKQQLISFHVPPEVIVAGLVYIRPEERLSNSGMLMEACPPQPDISIIDGVDAAMAMQGLSPLLAVDYRQWLELEVRPIQRATAGAVVMIDHVPKSKETRGDWAVGTYQKRAAIDGASFAFELVQPFGVGLTGAAKITLAKDRPGALRGQEGIAKEIARLWLTSHYPEDASMITWELLPPTSRTGSSEAVAWQPTMLMQRISLLLEGAGAPQSMNSIETAVSGRRAYIRQALACLVQEGFVEAFNGANRARLHRSVKPYPETGQAGEEGSPQVRPQVARGEQDSEFAPSPPPLYRGGEGTRPS